MYDQCRIGGFLSIIAQFDTHRTFSEGRNGHPRVTRQVQDIHEFLLSNALIYVVKVKWKSCSEFGEELQHLKRLLQCSVVLNLAAWMIPPNGISFEEARI